MILPSKELLSEVLKINNKVSWYFEIKDNTLFYDGDYNLNGSINIHELAHKCKEWAIGNNWRIDSSISIDLLGQAIVYHITERLIPSKWIYNQDTEPDAIFKATSYIIEQLKQKD